MKAGQIVFTKKLRNSPLKKAGAYELTLKNYCICLLIGAMNKTKDVPSIDDMTLMLGEIGWFSGADISEFFGEKKWEAFSNHYRKKYDPPTTAAKDGE